MESGLQGFSLFGCMSLSSHVQVWDNSLAVLIKWCILRFFVQERRACKTLPYMYHQLSSTWKRCTEVFLYHHCYWALHRCSWIKSSLRYSCSIYPVMTCEGAGDGICQTWIPSEWRPLVNTLSPTTNRTLFCLLPSKEFLPLKQYWPSNWSLKWMQVHFWCVQKCVTFFQKISLDNR